MLHLQQLPPLQKPVRRDGYVTVHDGTGRDRAGTPVEHGRNTAAPARPQFTWYTWIDVYQRSVSALSYVKPVRISTPFGSNKPMSHRLVNRTATWSSSIYRELS